MKKRLLWVFGWLSVCAAVFAGGNNEAAPLADATANAAASGGKPGGRERVIILEPELAGFPESDDSQLRGYVQGILRDNFAKYSGMTVSYEMDLDPDTIDYLLEVKLAKDGPRKYTIRLTLLTSLERDTKATSGFISATSESNLKFGTALNWATRELLLDKKVKLSAAARSALSKPVSDEQAGAFFLNNPSDNRWEDEQKSNDFGGKRPPIAPPDVPDVPIPDFDTPTIPMPSFTPPAIRVFTARSTGEDRHASRARWQETQAANKAAVEEQQDYLIRQGDTIRGQWAAIIEQWEAYLGEVEAARQRLRATEQELFHKQAELEEELKQVQEYYRKSPPFRILYDPIPKETYDPERDPNTMSARFRIASEPRSLKSLTDRLDNLVKLNKSFTAVNRAFEQVNAAVAARYAQVQNAINRAGNALDKVRDALDEVNVVGQGLRQGYKVAPKFMSTRGRAIPSATTAYGAKLKTSWGVDYPRSFNITACLLDVRGPDDITVLKRIRLTLTNNIAWNGPLKPEPDSGWYSFDNVWINDTSKDGTLVVWVESVNGIDVDTASRDRYIEVIADGSRIPGIGWQTDVRESWRHYWSDNRHFNSLEVAAGTAGFDITPAFLVSGRLTFSPFRYFFFETGADVGLAHGMRDVLDVEYLSIAPYLHLNFFYDIGDVGSDRGFVFSPYGGVGGGMNFSRYTYPTEPDPVTVNVDTWVFDFNGGVRFVYGHSVIDLRATIKTNFETGMDARITVGYGFRFGYFAPRYGGMPARLTGLN
jgi:hypothetical protein